MSNFFDNQRILNIIWRRKFHFIIIGLIAIILSAIFSGPAFITPKFKSTARTYPINLKVFSEESETEQMLEVMNSSDIKYRMFDAFRLDTVYDIDRNDTFYRTYMMGEYNSNVNVSKTQFETVQIKVLDKSSQRASDMCDSIITFYNDKVKQMYDVKYGEMLTILDGNIKTKKQELDSVIILLNRNREESGVISYRNQIEKVTEGYMEALNSGRQNSASGKKITNLYNSMTKNGAEALILETKFNDLVFKIDSFSTMYDTYSTELNKEITYCHVVEHPIPADKKSYPVRWLIVALTTFAALFFALVLFLILDYRKEKA